MRGNKAAHDIDGPVDKTARIIPQIHDQSDRSFSFEPIHGLVKFPRRLLSELGDAQVTDFFPAGLNRRKKTNIGQGRDLDHFPHQGDFQGTALRRAVKGQGHRRTGPSPKFTDRLGQGELLGSLSIDLQNPIPGHESRPECRAALNRHVDGQLIIHHAHGNTQTPELALRLRADHRVVLGIQKLAVGVKGGKKPPERGIGHLVVICLFQLQILVPNKFNDIGEKQGAAIPAFLFLGSRLGFFFLRPQSGDQHRPERHHAEKTPRIHFRTGESRLA